MTALALVWVAGLGFLWRSRRPLWPALAWAYGLRFIFFALSTGAKRTTWPGRTSTCSPPARWRSTGGWRPGPGRLRTPLLATVVTAAAPLPLALPVLLASSPA
jgi:hypothetical protein